MATLPAAWLYRVNLLVGLVVKAWSSRAADTVSIPSGGVGILFVCSFGFVFVCVFLLFFLFCWGGGGGGTGGRVISVA